MENERDKIFKENNLLEGRSLAWSKSAYEAAFPDNETYFNGKIYVEGEGKIWNGDLDMNFDGERIKKVAEALNKNLYVFSDVQEEPANDSEIIQNASATITKD